LSSRQTDNSYLNEKIALRERYLPDKKNINVLELFSGHGIIWNNIKYRNPDININVLRIDIKDIKGCLRGNNLKFIPALNVKNYDIIDIDAYGVPFDQLELLFKQDISGIAVFVTFTQVMFGALPVKMLNKLGYTKSMVKKCRTLFSLNGFDKFCGYLYLNGVRYISYYHKCKKYYLYFKI